MSMLSDLQAGLITLLDQLKTTNGGQLLDIDIQEFDTGSAEEIADLFSRFNNRTPGGILSFPEIEYTLTAANAIAWDSLISYKFATAAADQRLPDVPSLPDRLTTLGNVADDFHDNVMIADLTAVSAPSEWSFQYAIAANMDSFESQDVSVYVWSFAVVARRKPV